MKSLKVSDENWQRIMKWRIDLKLKSVDELIEKILKIVKASEIKKDE